MQIAIYGGSFDPVHTAHVEVVSKALKKLDIDKLIVVPAYLNPFKQNFYLEPKLRFDLLKKVFNDVKNVQVSDYEISQEKVVYSIQTVKYLKKLYNASKIYFIIGADNLKALNKWNSIEELKSLVTFVVATRKDYEVKKKNFLTLDVSIDISSTSLREKLDLDFIPIQIKDDILKIKNKGEIF